MHFLRKWYRFTLVFLVLIPVLFSLRALVWPVVWVNPALDRRLRRVLLQAWTTGFTTIAHIEVTITGTPPKPPFFLVANHLSYMDMLLLCKVTGCIFVSREDVEHWPVIGFLAKAIYIIFIDRKNRRDTMRVNRLIAEAMELGDGVAVFAESRISVGHDVEPFKSSLIQPAVDNGVPVHYATLSYESLPGMPPANEVVCWWRPEPFFYHLFRLLGQPGFRAAITFGDAPISGDDRKELADRLWVAVRENFVPVE